MELRQLRTLVAIADAGTFAAAADTVGLTQSAVSLQIKGLEQEIGTAIFDRRHRPPVLNERGLELVEQARKVLDLCRTIISETSTDRLEGIKVSGEISRSSGKTVAPIATSKAF